MVEPLAVVLEVIRVLEEMGVSYHLGGSFASSVHGIPRQTHDADLVVELEALQVPRLIQGLGADYYLDEESIRLALARSSAFNVIHLETGFKIDLFSRGNGAFDRMEFARHRRERLREDPLREVFVKSPEDTVLRKLAWYREGGMSSERQWLDVLGVIRTQGERLDAPYLRQWASRLELTELLERALEESD